MDCPNRKGVTDLLQKVDFVEQLLPHLPEHSVKVLKATNRSLRQLLQAVTPSLRLSTQAYIPLLLKYKWPSLTTLQLSRCSLAPDHIALLAQGGIQQLQILDLSHSEMQPEAFHQLAKGQWTSLKTLDLASSLSMDQASDTLLACQYLSASLFPALTSINLSNNSLSTAALSQLTKADWPALQELNLSANQHRNSPGFIAQLALAPWARLQHVNLSENMLTVEDAQVLGQLTWPLVSLHLGDCFHGSSAACIAAMAFLSAGQWPNLESLVISHSHLTSDSIAELLKGRWPALQSLDLSFSQPRLLFDLFNSPAELTKAPWSALPCANNDSLDARRHAPWLGHLSAGAVVTMRPRINGSSQVEAMVLGFEAGQRPQLHTADASYIHLTLKYDLPDVASWIKTVLPRWGDLGTLDISGSTMGADDVHTLLGSRLCSLKTLSVSCEVTTPVEYMPASNDWPINTELRIIVRADPATLRSLSAGYWPAQRLTIANGGKHSSLSMNAMQALHSWDLPALQTLILSGLGIARGVKRADFAHLLASCDWPNLQELDLSSNHLNSEFVHVLEHAKWPQLVELDLSLNPLGSRVLVTLLDANMWYRLAKVVVDYGMLSEDQKNLYDHTRKRLTRYTVKRPASFCDSRWPGIEISPKFCSKHNALAIFLEALSYSDTSVDEEASGVTLRVTKSKCERRRPVVPSNKALFGSEEESE